MYQKSLWFCEPRLMLTCTMAENTHFVTKDLFLL